MAAAYPMMHETVWFDQSKFEKAEAHHQEQLAQAKYGVSNSPAAASSQEASSDLVNEIARARQHIQSSLNTSSGGSGVDHTTRIENLEKENNDLRKIVNGLCERIKKLELQVGSTNTPAKPAEQAKPEPAKKEEESDDDSLFGSDSEEDEETARLMEEKKEAELAAKAKKKPPPVGKSSIVFAVKGWDDETDFKTLEANIRKIEKEGLRWGLESKLVPVAYGVQKLILNAIVVDDLVGTDFIEESILQFEDDVQSVDIEAFNKI